ncbi:hypothetical protein AAFF_G00047230 [Aldrovandia affinis]|uniref:Uncharacterized protein n=1 Tax=Aldrovandia affinis TaxID=143900 RepID=A0AAD7WEP2_9TELE|nr:hypothetical protein AAFF_G00047230 [Aldrovandia affinis]
MSHDTSSGYLTLPHWDNGEGRIRFLYLAGSSSFKMYGNCSAEEMMVPLFLGADVFSKTDIRTENHPRYHAKFAKKGLATKLVFSSEFRFHGLRLPTASNSLWFYSIQGLFRVAFELYNKQEQLLVLEAFQELWKWRINDGPLNMCYDLTVQLDAPQPDDTVQMHKEMHHRRRSPKASGTHLDLTGAAEALDAVPERDTSPPDGTSTADHDYCSPADGDSATQTDHLCPIFQKLRSLDIVLQASKCDMGKEQQEAIVLLLDHVERYVRQGLDEGALADTVSGLLRTQGLGPGEGGLIYSSPLLCAIGSWLGRQFHAANACISRQVEGFKMQHIEHITDLPPAEELVEELFPEAMRVLLLNWMGLDEASALWKRQSEYPILLLILEFANHNLITGVAHVLYSSLICK